MVEDTGYSKEIRTEIDEFYTLVRVKNPITLDEASSILKIEKDIIEKYAGILAQIDMITAKYPIVGKPEYSIAKKGADKEVTISKNSKNETEQNDDTEISKNTENGLGKKEDKSLFNKIKKLFTKKNNKKKDDKEDKQKSITEFQKQA